MLQQKRTEVRAPPLQPQVGSLSFYNGCGSPETPADSVKTIRIVDGGTFKVKQVGLPKKRTEVLTRIPEPDFRDLSV